MPRMSILFEELIQQQRRLFIEEETGLSKRVRTILAVMGAAIVLVSLLLLAYAKWPGNATREQDAITPSAFMQPQ